jgi:hypothetical protein
VTDAETYGAHAPPSARGDAPTARDNLRVWDGARRGHYEVWYLTASHLAARTGLWIRYTIESPLAGHGEPYAQLWFASFDHGDPARNVAINKRFPIGDHGARTAPFEITVGEARLGNGGARGRLAGRGHEVSWDLRWTPGARTYRQLPSLVYRTGFGDTKVLTPNLDVALRGEVVIDGRTLRFDGDPAGQTHVWGRKHAYEWAWGHCNAFEGRRGVALETLTVRLKRRGVVLPPLTVLGLELDGELHRWGEFRHTPFTRGSYSTGSYHFSALAPDVRLEGEYSCRPEDMTLTEYHDPDGEPSYCANTCAGDLRITVYRRGWLGRFKEAARLHAPGTGHFEVAMRSADPAITRRHLTVP